MSTAEKIHMAMEKSKIFEFERYQYGALSARLLADKGSSRFAPSALEVLAGVKGLNLGEESLEFIKSYGEITPEQLKNATGVYAQKFEEKRGSYKPQELEPWYDSILTGLKPTEREKILAQLKCDETLNQIREKYEDAQTVHDASDRLFTPEKKAEAKKTLENYQNLLGLIGILDSYKFESLRGDAVDVERVNTLKSLASKL